MDDVPLRRDLAGRHADLRHRHRIRVVLARSVRRAGIDRLRLGLRRRPVDGVPHGRVSGDGARGHGGRVGDQQHDRADLHLHGVRLARGVGGAQHVHRHRGAGFRVRDADGADDDLGEALSPVDASEIQGVCED